MHLFVFNDAKCHTKFIVQVSYHFDLYYNAFVAIDN